MEGIPAGIARRITEFVRRRRAEPQRPNRPLGLFLLAGPGGAGAIQVARAVAESTFGDSGAILRFDMAEYQEKYQISDLIGPPPGIVGYGAPGLLPESVRLNPDQIILLERIEEAHTDAQRILLDIAERGIVMDNYGRDVDYRSTVLLITTAAGVVPQDVILPELFELLDDVIDCGGLG
jgi:ATP-dependent Clp protease ATP-binding subunit ClpC